MADLTAVADQLAELLIVHLDDGLNAIDALDLAAMARARVDEVAPRLAAQLCGDDPHLAAQTARDLAVIWPDDPEPELWRTPLGRAFAEVIGSTRDDSVTYAEAAAILGVAVGTIKSYMARETYMERHQEGGLTMSSVLARLVR